MRKQLANFDRGIKREDPDTGKKFYDLNKDPIVSPYTGKSYPRSYFDQPAARGKSVPDRTEEADKDVVAEPDAEDEVIDAGGPEIVSLEEADAEEAGDDDVADVEDVEDVEDLGADDADVFLEEDEDEDEDLDFDVDTADDR
jgi:uncharacterized protein (TIGR02300 family)